jgi:hypothetical protein
MNLLKMFSIAILVLVASSSAFARPVLKVGMTVLVHKAYNPSKERVTEISADGLVRTTFAFGTDFIDASEISEYKPVKSLTTRSWYDLLTGKPATTIKIGDVVLVNYGYLWSKETVTDLTADGYVRTTVGYGDDYLPLSAIKPFHSVQ